MDKKEQKQRNKEVRQLSFTDNVLFVFSLCSKRQNCSLPLVVKKVSFRKTTLLNYMTGRKTKHALKLLRSFAVKELTQKKKINNINYASYHFNAFGLGCS